MARRRNNSNTRPTVSRRTQIVWATFLVAMTAATGFLAIQHPSENAGYLLASVDVRGANPARDSLLRTSASVRHDQWSGIVIHHLGAPAGDPESIHRSHLRLGYRGLGYHFLIGNGNGLSDGVVHVGFRWDQQLPGAHVIGRTPLAMDMNLHTIGICLIGNGDQRPFTQRQIEQLVNLVQRLQVEFKIPSSQVYLHRDLVASTSSPGRLFPAAQFRQQLRD